MQKNLGTIRSSGTEVDIIHLPIHNLWLVTHANSNLCIFSSPKANTIPTQTIFKPHQQPLTTVCEISTPLAVCTASLDGNIRLWNAVGSRLIIQLSVGRELGLSFQEKKGVKGIVSYSKGITSYICSWMFTSSLFLWLPSLSLSKPFAG